MENKSLYIKERNKLLIKVRSFNLKEVHVGYKALIKESYSQSKVYEKCSRVGVIIKITPNHIIVKFESDVLALVKRKDIECLLLELN
ncbi:hypothetical protein [Radiobacillus sp. PE A8.2]|uniref:hypothetical protein n=1 Tax=Radiobacillus sp. PE A8.2 TaxID=3380349 RepID=UPI003890EFEA